MYAISAQFLVPGFGILKTDQCPDEPLGTKADPDPGAK
jgi:hypothetical protein